MKRLSNQHFHEPLPLQQLAINIKGKPFCQKMIVDVRNSFTPILTYVVLSRVMERCHLLLMCELTLVDFWLIRI
jgi:hypothetical protein